MEELAAGVENVGVEYRRPLRTHPGRASSRAVAPHFVEFLPAAPLRDIVAAFWVHTAPPAPTPHVVIPDGCFDLVLTLEESNEGNAFAFGPITACSEVTLETGTTYAGIRLQPWVGAAALGIDGSSLTNQIFALPQAGYQLQRLSSDISASLTLLTDVAHGLADGFRWTAHQRAVREAYARIACPEGAHSVRELGADLGVADRTLRRAFEAVTGSGPKFALRVARFQRALAGLGTTSSLAHLAYACGYADQAHLCNELSQLAGTTPSVLQRRARLAEISKTQLNCLDRTEA